MDALKRENEMLKEQIDALMLQVGSVNEADDRIMVQVDAKVEEWKVSAVVSIFGRIVLHIHDKFHISKEKLIDLKKNNKVEIFCMVFQLMRKDSYSIVNDFITLSYILAAGGQPKG